MPIPTYRDLFSQGKPVIAVIHLLALPGAPGYEGDLDAVYARAIAEAELFIQSGVDALIVENFRDIPFYPERVPHETVAAMAAICREIRNRTRPVGLPLGVNVLRNDADAALSIAATVGAQFIRVNVHNAAALTDQGVVQGRAYDTLRKRNTLRAPVLIMADVAVKHAVQLAPIPLAIETRDLTERSLADALIVSGTGTGAATDLNDLRVVKENTHLPVWIGSGTTPSNIRPLNALADGFIVGSYFKRDGKAEHPVDASRIKDFMQVFQALPR
jgi:hypothetical protein